MGFFEGRQSFSLVLEYAAQGDLLNYMISIQDHERLVKARHFLWQITKALHYLETLQVAHRDIKPENIVVVSDCVTQNPTVKLCDFGWAIWFKPGHRRSTLCGTAEYCPPEMLARRHPYSAEYVDRWMLGVLAFELIHNCTPFATTKLLGCTDDYTATIFDKIRNFRSLETTITMKQNPEYLDFVSCLMQVEPTDRFSALKALEHSFFKSMRCFRSAPTKMQGPSVAQLRQIFQKAI